jgi:hypothetical protein
MVRRKDQLVATGAGAFDAADAPGAVSSKHTAKSIQQAPCTSQEAPTNPQDDERPSIIIKRKRHG